MKTFQDRVVDAIASNYDEGADYIPYINSVAQHRGIEGLTVTYSPKMLEVIARIHKGHLPSHFKKRIARCTPNRRQGAQRTKQFYFDFGLRSTSKADGIAFMTCSMMHQLLPHLYEPDASVTNAAYKAYMKSFKVLTSHLTKMDTGAPTGIGPNYDKVKAWELVQTYAKDSADLSKCVTRIQLANIWVRNFMLGDFWQLQDMTLAYVTWAKNLSPRDAVLYIEWVVAQHFVASSARGSTFRDAVVAHFEAKDDAWPVLFHTKMNFKLYVLLRECGRNANAEWKAWLITVALQGGYNYNKVKPSIIKAAADSGLIPDSYIDNTRWTRK